MEARSKASLDKRVRKGENEEGGIQKLRQITARLDFFFPPRVCALCLNFFVPWSHKMSQPGSIYRASIE